MASSSAPSAPPVALRAFIASILLVAPAALACGRTDTGGGSGAVASAAPTALSTAWYSERNMPLGIGDRAPDFEAIVHTGARVRLSHFLAKPTVVYFYPGDASHEAKVIAEQFRARWLALNPRLSMVFGVSAEPSMVHRELAMELELPFLLVTDTDLKLTRSFGVPVENGQPKVVAFLIGKDGKVLRAWANVAPEALVQEVEQALGAEG